jgi:hypothetical protein
MRDEIDELMAESARGLSLLESQVLPALVLHPEQASAVAARIRAHPDHTSYHLLFALRRLAGEACAQLPAAVRAQVLCGALGHVIYLNDWGYLEPGESYDGEAAVALLETGNAALGCLQSLLIDRRPAPLFGSEVATLSSLHEYRRCDFAYRYAALLLEMAPSFDPQPERRDVEIERLIGRTSEQARDT